MLIVLHAYKVRQAGGRLWHKYAGGKCSNARTGRYPQPWDNVRASTSGSRWRRGAIPVLVSSAALMAGALASSDAQAQCTGGATKFNNAGAISALVSTIGTVNTAFMTSGSAFVSAPLSAPDQQSGGLWVRTTGGTVTTKADSLFVGTTLSPKPVMLSCHLKVEQNFKGFQAGHDIAVLNSGDWGANWHFGVLAGYIGANAKDLTPGQLDGSLNANFNAPFVGLYTAFTRGKFFADAQARLDYYQGEFLGERLDARGYSITGNAGYHLDLGGKWSLEPSVGGVFSRTSADSVGVYSGLYRPTGAWGQAVATMQVHDVESALGRASLKLGTSVALEGGQVMAYPFVSASVYHEFADDVTTAVESTRFSAKGGLLPADGPLTVSRVGTYAQYSVGSAFALPGTGLLSYIRADYRTGDNIEGVSVISGLRYQLNPEETGFKDGGSLKDGPVWGYYWTGPYIGGSVSGVWGNTHWDYQGNTADPDYAGRLVSGQAGYNFQRGKLVWGVEADFGVMNARGAELNSTTSRGEMLANGVTSYKDDIGSLGSVTGRLGYTWGRALFYGKGGLAFAEVQAGEHTSGPALTAAGEPVTAETLATNWEAGWTAGGGMEFALSDKWSAKAEYMHYELGKEMFNLGADNASISTSGELVRVGVNYHLGR